MTHPKQPVLDRRHVVENLLADRGELLVVAGLGASAWDITAAGDYALNFPLWGGMGSAATIGLGLALAQPERRVLVITGDGEMLMGLGSFATIAVQAPKNLAVVVLDNERYGETGMQETHTAFGTDLAGMAAAAGIAATATIRNEAELQDAVAVIRHAEGPIMHVIKVKADTLPKAVPPKDGAYLRDRFRMALLGDAAAV
ncbi:MAG: aldehyde dehydrogenase [Rhodospirillales bacterium]|nr:aldehyde dehydrogenase [Rhodospirillales bacterium]